MDAGFARLEGSLALISQAQDRAAADLEDLDERVTALESRRWPMGSVATLSGVVSGAVAFAAFTLGK